MDSASSPRSAWRTFTQLYSDLLSFVMAISVGILVIPVTLQIVSRYTSLIPAYIWTEEMARFLFVWTVMIGAMIGVRESTHFEVDVWPKVSPRGEAFARLLGRLGVLALALVFIWSGIEFTKFAWRRTSELADMPLWLIHIAWPIAGVTWIIFLGQQFVDDLKILVGGRTS
jgi:TRAP-type C4-dicarboxylate transport system permease small subunit